MAKKLKVKTSIKGTVRKLTDEELAARREAERMKRCVEEAVRHPGWTGFIMNRKELLGKTPEELAKTYQSWFRDEATGWSEEWSIYLEGWNDAEERYNVPNYDL